MVNNSTWCQNIFFGHFEYCNKSSYLELYWLGRHGSVIIDNSSIMHLLCKDLNKHKLAQSCKSYIFQSSGS